jgi:pimeloyl-ACP methyl ester carboxylesterase
MSNLTDFTLVGHSYGGYVAGTYASIYPQHVNKLILLSPLGLKIPPKNWNIEGMRFKNDRGPPRWAISVSKFAWGHLTPFQVLRNLTESRVRRMLSQYVKKH